MKLLSTLTTGAMIAVASLAAIGGVASAIDHQPPFGPFEGCVPLWRVAVGFTCMCVGIVCALRSRRGIHFLLWFALFVIGSLIWLTGHYKCTDADQGCPAMAAGVERDFWTLENLVEAAHD